MWVFEELPKGCNDMAKIENIQQFFNLFISKVPNPWLLDCAFLLTLRTQGKRVLRGIFLLHPTKKISNSYRKRVIETEFK